LLAYHQRIKITFENYLLLLCVPFFIYLFFFTFRYDTSEALEVLVRTLPILIVPVLVSLNSKIIISFFDEIIKFYLLGLTISCLFTIIIGLYHFIMNGFLIEALLYFELAEYLSLHPTYYSLFIITGVIFLLFHKRVKNVNSLLMLFFFIIIIFLLQSRMAYILLTFVLGYYFYKRIRNDKVYALSFFTAIILVIIVVPNSLSRFKELSVGFKSEEELIGNNKENGISQRVWLWSNAWSQIKDKPGFGYGFRAQQTVFKWNIEKENLLKNRGYDYDMAAIKLADWNLHNQYLQMLYESGFFGLIVFLLSIGVTIKLTYLSKNTLFLLVYLVFLAFLFTENMLDRQMGIYFYSFILPVLLCDKSS